MNEKLDNILGSLNLPFYLLQRTERLTVMMVGDEVEHAKSIKIVIYRVVAAVLLHRHFRPNPKYKFNDPKVVALANHLKSKDLVIIQHWDNYTDARNQLGELLSEPKQNPLVGFMIIDGNLGDYQSKEHPSGGLSLLNDKFRGSSPYSKADEQEMGKVLGYYQQMPAFYYTAAREENLIVEAHNRDSAKYIKKTGLSSELFDGILDWFVYHMEAYETCLERALEAISGIADDNRRDDIAWYGCIGMKEQDLFFRESSGKKAQKISGNTEYFQNMLKDMKVTNTAATTLTDKMVRMLYILFNTYYQNPSNSRVSQNKLIKEKICENEKTLKNMRTQLNRLFRYALEKQGHKNVGDVVVTEKIENTRFYAFNPISGNNK